MLRNIGWLQKLCGLMLFGFFVLSITSMLTGCGNKGNLYLPEKDSLDKKNSTQDANSKLKKKKS